MEKYKSLVSSGLFTVFFAAQAIGYMHGQNMFEKINVDSSIAFGVYHLSHIFQPHNAVAWPLSPLLCGFLLLMIPFLENDWKNSIVKKNFIGVFIALFIPLTISIIQVSVIGPKNAATAAHEFSTWLKYPVVMTGIYFTLYLFAAIVCWRFRDKIMKFLVKVQLIFPKSFLVLIAILWLLYGCYIGSRFDGTLDGLNLTNNENFLTPFFKVQ